MTGSVRELETPGGSGRAHIERPRSARGTVVLSHGAGGGIGALDLQLAREVLVSRGWVVVLVEQPWLVAGRRVAGPPRVLDAAWVPMVEELVSGRRRLPRPLVVGGRSAGARVACRTATTVQADGALLLSFPLHPPGRPDRLRADELALAPSPTAIIQGTRDPFGTPAELAAYLRPGTVLRPVAGAHTFPASAASALRSALDEIAGMLPG